MSDSIYKLMMSGTLLGQFMQIVPITCLVGIVYAVFRFAKIKSTHLNFTLQRELIYLLFVCYITGLINLVLVPANLWTYIWFYLRNGYSGCELDPLFSGGFNLVPMLIKVLSGSFSVGIWVRTMLSGNLLMFIPFGAFLPLISSRVNNRNIWAIASGIPVIIEIIQPVLGRSFDVDDIILNFAGIVIGYFIFSLLLQLYNFLIEISNTHFKLESK